MRPANTWACFGVIVTLAAGCGREPAEPSPYVDARSTRAVLIGSLSDGRAAAGAWVGIAVEGAAGPAANVTDTATFVEGQLQPRVMWVLTNRTLHFENRESGVRNLNAVPFGFGDVAAFAPRERSLEMHAGIPLSIDEMAGGIYAVDLDASLPDHRAGTIVVLPSVPWLTQADAQGRFRFDDLPPGRGTLVVVAADGRAAAREVEVKAGSQTLPPLGLTVPR